MSNEQHTPAPASPSDAEIAELRRGLGQIAAECFKAADLVKVTCCSRIDAILARFGAQPAAPAGVGEYPTLPKPDRVGIAAQHHYSEKQMRAYVDADRAQRQHPAGSTLAAASLASVPGAPVAGLGGAVKLEIKPKMTPSQADSAFQGLKAFGTYQPAEDAYLEDVATLNCPTCGGSGHIDDTTPVPQAGAPASQQPVAWWRTSYIDEAGHSDADVQIGPNKPTEQVLSNNGFEWEPLYATPQSGQTLDEGSVDCLGIALELEDRANYVESQTTQRAMLAGAQALRLILEDNAAAPVPQVRAVEPGRWPREADPLTQAIQRLNSTTYNLTKDECIAVLRELRDSAPVFATQPPAGSTGEGAEPVVADAASVMRWLDANCRRVAWSVDSATFEVSDEQAFALVTSFLAAPVAEVHPDAADAARYRWLRENTHPMDGSIQVLDEPENDGPYNHLYGVHLDATIDAALQAGAPKGGDRG